MRLYLFLSLLVLTACEPSNHLRSEKVSKSHVILIKLGEPVQDVISKSPVKFDRECLDKASICFYKIDKPFIASDLPAVTVNGALTLTQVAAVMITEDQLLSDKVENLSLTIRSLPSNSRHEDNQNFIHNLIANLSKSGWAPYYRPNDPRISGFEYFKTTSPDAVFGEQLTRRQWLDPDYKMDKELWSRIGDIYYWHFFKEGDYLTLTAWRHDSNDMPDERGTYLVSLDFKTESTHWRHAFHKEEDQNRWQELLPGLLAGYGQKRKALEDKARAAGIKIDTGYQDPPIKALQSR